MKTYAVSDLHLFHKNIIKYSALPFASVEELNGTWAKMLDCVRQEDAVWFLGDLSLARTPTKELNSILASFKGQKFLIRGNHDLLPDKAYINCGFQVLDKLFHIYKLFHILDIEQNGLYRFILCHYPPDSKEYNQLVAENILEEWTQKEAKTPALKTFWLHGHTHTSTPEPFNPDAINVCIDFRYHAKWPIFCFEDFLVRMP
ncbi:metallophosphoesterase [Helicobacter heilmannii]|uniref:Uncharacterized protein n=1 Tax=Helicobacter heilmannii TaxID=35817 RepID=A0A0K2Y4K7_HELHE|nr:metallophosphoesterase [Helicobacter heilmannii]BDQ27721.1 hypothetical protein ASB1_13970 [Helicobacter heilmannii]CRI33728.1 M. jannaschii predicted coding region MJ1445 [Helicobacter heilmannii]